VILSHEPERQFLFRLIEHGRLLDSWVKAPDTEFYSVDYEYWRHGRDRVRRSFNPDFFIRLDIDHYLTRLPPDAIISGASRLRELQNEGIEQLVLVVEIKSDDDNTDETRAKEAFAKEHFAALNRRLRDTQEVDVAEPFRNSVRQHYIFALLRPHDYPGWFSRLGNGLVALNGSLRQTQTEAERVPVENAGASIAAVADIERRIDEDWGRNSLQMQLFAGLAQWFAGAPSDRLEIAELQNVVTGPFELRDLENAAMYFVGPRTGLLRLVYELHGEVASPPPVSLPPTLILEALTTGALRHPTTGEMVSDFEEKTLMCLVATTTFRQVIRQHE
jgi:hypothetical protein